MYQPADSGSLLFPWIGFPFPGAAQQDYSACQLEEFNDIYQLMPYFFLVNGIVFGGSQFVLQIIQQEVLQNSNWIEKIEVRNVSQFGVWTFSHSSCRLVFRYVNW